jgi:archaemetzincin
VKPIHLIPLGAGRGGIANGYGTEPGLDVLEYLAAALARTFRTPCRIGPQTLDIAFSLDGGRRQHYSSAIIQRLERGADPAARVLGVAGCDLYVPLLTFVFGEAQLDGNCAVVSIARLKEEFYGMPPRGDLLRERLVKEASHELGHTFGLRHCADWRCVMASSHAVERLDVKGAQFCRECRGLLHSRTALGSRNDAETYLRREGIEAGYYPVTALVTEAGTSSSQGKILEKW